MQKSHPKMVNPGDIAGERRKKERAFTLSFYWSVYDGMTQLLFHDLFGMDGITSDIIELQGQIALTYLTNIFNNILKTKQMVGSKTSNSV